jgi:hypothetical protein
MWATPEALSSNQLGRTQIHKNALQLHSPEIINLTTKTKLIGFLPITVESILIEIKMETHSDLFECG